LAVIQSAVKETLAVLQDPAYQGQARRQERLSQAEALLLPHFDTEAFARSALGIRWGQRTPDEQREFVTVFTALLARSYTDIIDRHARGVKVSYENQRIDGSDAEVDTRVFSPAEDQPVSINYMMHQVNGEWLIYDMQIDDVSLVLNYRSQFNHFLNKSSYAALMQTMRSRLQQLTAS
jgi:phospholipid transport system substrate-binding protein